jgi:hypothetical protein
MKNYIRFKAGKAILERVRQEGLRPESVRVLAGPAGGPKWFVSVGPDRALMSSHFLEHAGHRVLLAGSSAGAWRCLAMMCSDPLTAYERLRIAYSRNIFSAEDTPRTISDTLRRNVDAFLTDADIPHVLHHPTFDVAVHTVRARGPAGSETKFIQGIGLVAAAAANALSSRALRFFYERVVFYAGAETPAFLCNSFPGRAVPLTETNLRKAALATGSLPYIIAGVQDIPVAPSGVYRDGGITDYQLNQDYCPGSEGITLFFHYQDRVVPGWFDKPFARRRPTARQTERVLQVCPGPDFLRLLPDGRLPDRNDFITFANDPAERIRRWDEVSETSAVLGEEFMNAVESGSIRHVVEPLD